MIIKKILSPATSIISLFILSLFFSFSSKSDENNIKFYSEDNGILSIMYHRFNEHKYPSTNINMEVFKKHLEIVKNSKYNFLNPNEFDSKFKTSKSEKEVLITIDDAFESFYNEAWPHLRDNKIPFILFVSTEPVGNKGYMTWDQIREIDAVDFSLIGHHSHSHEYLIEETEENFILDIETANKIFKQELNYIPDLFSYPFGEYSKFMRDYISQNFKYAFGQHSGVIDLNKNKFELPRFPINEKYGDISRFNTLMKTLPFKYKKITPEDKYLLKNYNPPKVEILFNEGIDNLNQISCFSNEGNKWRNSKINFIESNLLEIIIEEKFIGERGRINCSLKEADGFWRWLGIQFVISEK